jgi:APA family basic amino acid/polyamine antiporter
VVPVLAIVMCLIMVLPVFLDLIVQAGRGNGLPLLCLVGYGLAGVLLYAFYGHRNAARRAL